MKLFQGKVTVKPPGEFFGIFFQRKDAVMQRIRKGILVGACMLSKKIKKLGFVSTLFLKNENAVIKELKPNHI